MNLHLYPYQSDTSSSTLSAYRRLRDERIPPIFFWFILAPFLLWMVFNWGNDSEAGSSTWSALRTAETELTVASGAQHWPVLLKRLAGIESVEETAETLWKGFRELDERELLTLQGQQAIAGLGAVAGATGVATSSSQLEAQWERGELWAWSRIEGERLFEEGNAPEWWAEELAYYESYAHRKAVLALSGSLLWPLVFLLGLPFLPAALRCFRSGAHPPLSLAAKVWQPSRTTIFYIISDLLAYGFFFVLLGVIPATIWSDYPMTIYIGSDALWRVTGAVLMGIFFLVRWRHGIRLLGLESGPYWRLVAGMISLGVIVDWLFSLVLRPLEKEGNLLNLSSWEDGGAGLFYALLSSVVLAPLVEEVVYRGFLFQSYLKRFGFWLAIFFSTFLFTAIHDYGIYGSASVAFFGLCACVLYRATGSLWAAIIFHAVSNGLILLTSWPLYYGF